MTAIRKVSVYLKFETVEDERDGLSLDEYIEKYQIVWVLTERGNPLFVMSDLAESKGNNPKDYMNAVKRFMEAESENGENRHL
jgi:hypothetical protein